MLSQVIHNKILAIKDKGLFNRIILQLIYLIRKCILRFKDPIIKTDIKGFNMNIPLSHNLPTILKAYPQYSSNLGRIAKQVKQKYRELTFIDIGSNIGDSLAILRNKAEFPVLCIEGDNQFFSILTMNLEGFPGVYSENVYLGELTENKLVSVNKSLGTLHFNEKNNSSVNVRIEKLTDTLQKFKLFEFSKMIKIDTDGYDCKIIRGAIEFITKAKPVILFEYDPYFLSKQKDNDLSIFKVLKDIGYKGALIYDNFGDYMISLDLGNTLLVQDIHSYFSGHGGSRYCDICVFHSEDNDLWKAIRELEISININRTTKV